MNPNFQSPPTSRGSSGRLDRDAAEARYARRVAARLTEHADELPPDLGERLRFAREQALERARTHAAAAPAVAGLGGGALGLGRGQGPSWWWRLASVLPGVVLVAGLVLIQMQHDDDQAQSAADIDAALLSDDLPPTAYADPGFAEFLKSPGL